MLHIDKISRSFPTRGLVLDQLSLKISEGEMVSIMGPSGSGKTTLLNIAGLLDKPDSGFVYINDRNVSYLNDDESADYRNKNVGFVFQEHLLLPHLTVFENICLPLIARKGIKDTEADGYIHMLMEKTGITDISSKYPHQISGGEAQRTALLRALVNKPAILLADEPTGSLDSRNASILGDLLLEINRETGVTIVLATHSDDLAGKMKKKYRLESGKLVQS